MVLGGGTLGCDDRGGCDVYTCPEWVGGAVCDV